MATATRNGAQIILQIGDRVFKQDLVETGANSSCSISFLDGSAFNLSANCRMVLNEMVYNPGGTGNSQLFNLVAGAITFASGQVAKTGEMKVTTPIATLGVRGTVCNGQFEEEIDPATGQIIRKLLMTSLEHADGRPLGTCAALDPSGNVLAQADQPGIQVVLRVLGGQYSVTQVKLPAAELQAMQAEAARTEQFGMAALQNPIIDMQQQPGQQPGENGAAPNSGGGGGSGSSSPPPESIQDQTNDGGTNDGGNVLADPAPGADTNAPLDLSVTPPGSSALIETPTVDIVPLSVAPPPDDAPSSSPPPPPPPQDLGTSEDVGLVISPASLGLAPGSFTLGDATNGDVTLDEQWEHRLHAGA